MPELPEVETVRRGIEARALARRIAAVEVGRERSVRRTGRDSLVDGLRGARILSAQRRGKWLFFPLDNGLEMMVHLRMSGRLLVAPADEPRARHTHVVAGLEGERVEELRFVDPRTFGEVAVYPAISRATVVPEVARLGPDPLLDGIDPERLRAAMARTTRPAKTVLLDQSVVAGVGNIYGDEILHACAVSPLRPARAVTESEARDLAAAIVEILSRATREGGSTLADTQYVGADGAPGRFQDFHRVYARTGLPCLTCGKTPVVRTSVGGRSSHWCPRCQR